MDEMMMGPPMGDPMMGAPMPPPMGGPGGMPMPMAPPDPNAQLMELLGAVLDKWGGEEANLGMEKSALADLLMQLLQAGAPLPPMGMVEGGMPPVM